MKTPLTYLGSIVTLVLLGVALVYVASDTVDAQTRTLLVLGVLGLITNAIPSILALYKSEATQHDIRNGVVKDKVKEAIVEVAEDTDSEGIYLKTERAQ